MTRSSSTSRAPGARTPTGLVLWAAVRLSCDFDLPTPGGELPSVRSSAVRVNTLANEYTVDAYKTLALRGRRDPVEVAVALYRRGLAVAKIMGPIREKALEADTTASVDIDTWHLLVAIGTVAYVRRRIADLIEWVTRVASEIENLISEGSEGGAT